MTGNTEPRREITPLDQRERVVYQGTVDPQEAWYAKHLPLRAACIVDVGANVGRLSQFFWDQSERSSTITSIEPLSENGLAIERRIRAARAGKKWTVKRCAISSFDGHVKMHAARTRFGLNGVVAEEGLLTVACQRLEALVPDATVVKVDVEGHEHVFLPRAVRAMKNVRAWAIEVHRVAGRPLEDTLQLFAEEGFELFGAGAARNDPEGPWVDIAVTPKWTWDILPSAPAVHGGPRSTFKMLHLIALR